MKKLLEQLVKVSEEFEDQFKPITPEEQEDRIKGRKQRLLDQYPQLRREDWGVLTKAASAITRARFVLLDNFFDDEGKLRLDLSFNTEEDLENVFEFADDAVKLLKELSQNIKNELGGENLTYGRGEGPVYVLEDDPFEEDEEEEPND